MSPRPRRVDEVAWVPLAEAPSRVTYRDLRAALTEAARVLDEAADRPPP
jgi:hypothetical protein